ncbi:hypothetical protein SDC9_195336 [bioreactor metagenome]|uniref:Amidoligase enzyme n=1 Tax=bioreactor metagenome TaxID=1076179 RepID=A0A645IAA5_9ZZZZ
MSDGSIDCQKKDGRRKISADRNYSVELVSPICQYQDIETVQELIRKLREAGAFVNSSCGIHYGKKNVMLSYSAFSAVWHTLTLTVD